MVSGKYFRISVSHHSNLKVNIHLFRFDRAIARSNSFESIDNVLALETPLGQWRFTDSPRSD